MSSGNSTWRWCFGYGTATVRLRAWCLQLTAPGVGALATAKLRCAFALGVYCLLHLALVLELRPSYGSPSREVTSAYCTYFSFSGYGTATVSLRAWCLQLTPRGDGALDTAKLHLTFVLGLRHSYGAPSREVSSGYCTWRWCLSFVTATVRPRAI